MKAKTKIKKVRVNTGRLMIVLFFTLILVIGFYVFLNSGIFNIKNIEIKGNNRVKNEEIMECLGIENKKNIFMHSSKNLEEKLLKNSYIESVTIVKNMPNSLEINIKERVPVAILKNNDRYCYIDEKGNMLEILSDIDNENESIIVNIPYNINENKEIKFENEQMSKRLSYLLGCIQKNKAVKQLNNIEFQNNDIISIITKDGIKVTLHDDENLNYNISRMSSILVELQSDNIKNGTVDLTYGDYALYRP